MADHCTDCQALKSRIRELEKESAANYQELFENAPVMYVALENQHEDAVLRDCNALFLASLGYTRTEVIGFTISNLYTADSREKMYREQSLRRIRENTFLMTERELVCRDGEIIHTLVQAKPDINEHGEIIGLRCTFTNISVQKRELEQMKNELIQADKMISLGILVSGVAHEINNPNHLIMSNTPLLIEAWKSSVPLLDRYYRENGDFSLGGLPYTRIREEVPQLFEGIIEGSVRIHRIVKDLKDYARREEVDMDQAVDLNHVIKNAVRLTRNLIDGKTDHFNLVYGTSLPVVRGNRQKLEQVIINLIQNACQAISDREQGLEIATFLEPARNCLCVRVRDQGHGIPENLLTRIMDPFFTTSQRQGGTGLGLAVCLNIVTTHGGKIEVTSKPGQGSVFTVSLALNAAPKARLYDQAPGEFAGDSSPETLL